MRLNIFINNKISSETIPLDIIDDRSSQQVLVDIAIMLQLPLNSGQSADLMYSLCKAGKPLDLHRTLYENNIHNGETLVIEDKSFVENKPESVPGNSSPQSIIKPITSQLDEPSNTSMEKPKIPGKKIDFD